MPKVSVVMSTYNHEKYVEECINSVLNQTYKNFEFIIIDDGSIDATAAKVKQFDDSRIKFFAHQKNQGMGTAFNTGIKKTSGEFIATINSDDVWELDKLTRQIDFLNNHPQIAALFTKVKLIDEDSNKFNDETHPYFGVFKQDNRSRIEWLNHFFFKGNCLCYPSVMVRKSVYDDVGLYNERMGLLLDFEMWIRICLKYDIHILDAELVKFRIRANEANASGNKPESYIRGSFEYKQTLDHYLKITDEKIFLQIFPEATKYGAIKTKAIPYLLARMAIDTGVGFFQLWALEVLYAFLLSKDNIELLDREYNYSYVDFIRMSGTYDVFRTNVTINQLLVENAQLTNEINSIYNSSSWNSTRPLRWIKAKFAQTVRFIRHSSSSCVTTLTTFLTKNNVKQLFDLLKLKKAIVFLNRFPNAVELQDGYFQRVAAINSILLDYNKIYLRYDQNDAKNFLPKVTKIEDKTYEITISLGNFYFKWIQVFFIFLLSLRTGKIYAHSIFPIEHKFHRILFKLGRKRILDIHGVVPEEFRLCSDIANGKRFDEVERFAVNTADIIIGVTETMIKHIKTKHNLCGKNKIFIVLPVMRKITKFDIDSADKKEFIPNTVIYCGGTQQWQQIAKTLDFVHQNKQRLAFAFLVPEPQKISDDYFATYKENFPGVVQSVESSEVSSWYEKYAFGLVLREDIIVNNVACPTKLVEYLQHDVVPITDSANIGDFLDLEYAYVDYRSELPDVHKWEKMVKQNRNALRKIYEQFIYGVELLKRTI